MLYYLKLLACKHKTKNKLTLTTVIIYISIIIRRADICENTF